MALCSVLTRAVAAGTSGRLSILIFHRVLAQPDPVFPLEVDAQRFDRLMRVVARGYRVLPLSEAVERLQRGRLPPRAMAITFDDGYADNHDVALPILRRHGLSACFFVATGFLDGGRMFNDTVIEAVRRAPGDVLDLGALGLGRLPVATPAQRQQAIGRVLPLVKYRPPAERADLLAQVREACGDPVLPDDLMMRSGQVRALHAAGMEIGAHTVNHPILRTLDERSAEREIADSRDMLQALTGAPVRQFAYPNGRPDQDYDLRDASLVRRLGFQAAVSTAVGVATQASDVFQLPRYTPWQPGQLAWTLGLAARRRRPGHAVAALDGSAAVGPVAA